MQKPANLNELVAVGQIVRPIGIRGEVRVVPLTDDERRLEHSGDILVGRSAAEAVSQRVEHLRISGSAWVVKFFGIDSIEAAERLRGLYLLVPPAAVRPPRKGSYRIDEIIGCDVVTTGGRHVGQIRDVMTLPANDVWVVRDSEHEYLVPAVRALIRRVDLTARMVEVEELEGLFE